MSHKGVITRSKKKQQESLSKTEGDNATIHKESWNLNMKDIIDELKEENSKLIECFTNGFRAVVDAINDMKDHDEGINNNKHLLEKVDNLCKQIKRQNYNPRKNTKSKTNEIYDDVIKERRFKYYQYYRAEQLKEYYQELIHKDEPFVPPKFRLKINEGTPEFEKELKREHSIKNVVRECNLLSIRNEHLLKEIKQLDNSVETKINKLTKETKEKVKLFNQYKLVIEKEEKKSVDIWNKKHLKLKTTYTNLQSTKVEHCLKIRSNKTNDVNDT